MTPLSRRSVIEGEGHVCTQVTAEHFRQLREWGFVPYYHGGRLYFAPRDIYLESVASGDIEPGGSVQ